MKKLFPAFCCLLFFVSCTSKSEKLTSKKELRRNKSAMAVHSEYVLKAKLVQEQKIRDFMKTLPLEEKIAQLFIENLEGNTEFRSYETFDKITGNPSHSSRPVIAGGYLFFSYNLCDTVNLQKKFMESITAYSRKYEQLVPYLAIDQEGGYVNRLKRLTGGLPSQEKVSEKYSVKEAFDLYSQQALKMAELNFHMNFAPVIEVCSDENREFLNGRSFGTFEQTVSYGTACVNAYQLGNISAVIKHFPGNTNTDPHTGLPEISLSEEELLASIESFRRVAAMNPDGILMSHARTSAIDSGTPACLSKIWVTDILRNEFGYEGIIFSDDIFMGALADNGYPVETACIKAVDAGIDCIMISEKRFAKAGKILYDKAMEDKTFAEKIDSSLYRILEYKVRKGLLEL